MRVRTLNFVYMEHFCFESQQTKGEDWSSVNRFKPSSNSLVAVPMRFLCDLYLCRVFCPFVWCLWLGFELSWVVNVCNTCSPVEHNVRFCLIFFRKNGKNGNWRPHGNRRPGKSDLSSRYVSCLFCLPF